MKHSRDTYALVLLQHYLDYCWSLWRWKAFVESSFYSYVVFSSCAKFVGVIGPQCMQTKASLGV